MKRKEERSKQGRTNNKTKQHMTLIIMWYQRVCKHVHSQHSFACDKRSAPGQVEGIMNMPTGSHMHGVCFDAELHDYEYRTISVLTNYCQLDNVYSHFTI